jgi:hypothetical protein
MSRAGSKWKHSRVFSGDLNSEVLRSGQRRRGCPILTDLAQENVFKFQIITFSDVRSAAVVLLFCWKKLDNTMRRFFFLAFSKKKERLLF